MAIEVRTIQMRRGLAVDFNPNNMVPGEWAVSQDDEKIYMCFTAGRVIEIGSTASIIHYIEDAEAWAVGTRSGEPVDNTQPQYENNAKYYAEQGGDSATAAALSETHAAESESNAATSETHAEQYWNLVHDAIDLVVPIITMNWTTGQLEADGTSWWFGLNQSTGQLEWAVSHA